MTTPERRHTAPMTQADIAAGFVLGIKAAMKDDELMSDFWAAGYREMTLHASNGASQWIGRRILTAIIAAVTTAGIIWLVKSGALK